MKLKNLIILCAVFCILVGLVLVKKGVRRDIPVVEEEQDIIPSPFTLEDITEAVFRFGESGKEARLVKESSGWKIQSFYGADADTGILERFLKQINVLKGELRSDDASLFADYGIADSEGVHIILGKDAAAVAHLVVGLKRFGASGNFIRHQEQAKVYAAEENVLSEFGMWGEIREDGFDIKRWFDGRIARLDTEQATGLKVVERESGAEKVGLEVTQHEADGQKKWDSSATYAFGLSATKIKNLFRGLNDIRARDVMSSEKTQGAFAESFWSAEVSLSDGSQLVVTRGAKTEGGEDYHVKVSDHPYCFLVPVSVFDNFTRGIGDIFISNPLKVEAEGIDKFEVQDFAAKKKFGMVKSAEKTEDGERVVWKMLSGDEIEENKAKDIIQKFKGMDINLTSVGTVPAANALAVKVSRAQDAVTYTLTEKQKLEDGKECQFLKIADDPHTYCYPTAGVESFKAATPFLQ